MLVISALPQILLVGVAGRLADRVDPRPAPVSGAIVQLAAALALAWWTDLVATAIGVVVLQAGFAVANSAWVVALPRLVPDELAGSFISPGMSPWRGAVAGCGRCSCLSTVSPRCAGTRCSRR